MATATAEPRAAPREEPSAHPFVRTHILLLVTALAGVFAAQARTLSFFYFQDDYVPTIAKWLGPKLVEIARTPA